MQVRIEVGKARLKLKVGIEKLTLVDELTHVKHAFCKFCKLFTFHKSRALLFSFIFLIKNKKTRTWLLSWEGDAWEINVTLIEICKWKDVASVLMFIYFYDTDHLTRDIMAWPYEEVHNTNYVLREDD